MERARWAEYEDLTRERRVPPATVNYHTPVEPGLWSQLCEWIVRHWLLYLLFVAVAIAGTFLLLDSVRR